MPDETSLSATAKTKINRAIQATVKDVQRALSEKTLNTKIYLHPLQTVSKVLLDRLSSAPSSTTLSIKPNTVWEIADKFANISIVTKISSTPSTSKSKSEIGLLCRPDHDESVVSRSWRDYVRADEFELFLDIDSLYQKGGTWTPSMRLCAESTLSYAASQAFRIEAGKLRVDDEITTAFPDRTAAYRLLEHGNSQILV